MNLILLLLALNAAPVSSLGNEPRMGEKTMNRPYVSQAEYYARACERAEWNKPWTEPKVLKGNSTADRLRHDPE